MTGITPLPGVSGSAVSARAAEESFPRWTRAVARRARASSVVGPWARAWGHGCCGGSCTQECGPSTGPAGAHQKPQVELPADVLRSFTTSISDDLSFAADIQAALIELASRIQYRTEVLGSALGEVGQSVRGLQDGFSHLAVSQNLLVCNRAGAPLARQSM